MSTYTDASLIYYPSGVKAGKAYSLKPTDGSGDLTFTRASTATRVNESGLIEEVAANVPRLDNSQGGCSTLLLEPQRTNLFLNSNSTEGFNASNATRTLNQITSPDGSINASSVVCTNNFGNINKSGQAVTAGTKYVYSVFLKLKDTNWAYIRVLSTDLDYFVWIDLLNGIKGTDANSVGSIQDYGNGWFRCNIVFTNISATTANVYAYPTSSNNANSAIGNSFYAWGIQLEAGSYPTSYIPTTSTAVTRVKDFGNTNGLSTIINSVEGTIIFKASAASIAERGGISIGKDLLSSERISFYYSPGNILVVTAVSGGANISTLVYNYASINHIDEHCFGIVYSASGLKLFRDGALVKSNVNSASFTVNTFNSFSLFSDDVSYPLYGKLQQALIFQTVLSDAQLIELTTL